MTSTTAITLVDQRQALRQRLLAQRQLIADQLGPTPVVNGGYPRSKTMRFLTQRTGLAVTLLAEFAALLTGARYVKSMTAALAVARIVRSVSVTRPRGPPAQ
jgi:hypothetical protein